MNQNHATPSRNILGLITVLSMGAGASPLQAGRGVLMTPPIGRIVGTGLDKYTIVGVVDDVRHNGRLAQIEPAYLNLTDSGFAASIRPYFVMRTAQDLPSIAAALRAPVLQASPRADITRLMTLSAVVAESVARPRFNTAPVVIFAVAVYGVLMHAISQSTAEIAVRVAIAAAALTRSAKALLFGVVPLDPLTFAATALVFIIVAMVASFVPTRRALRIEPALALRHN